MNKRGFTLVELLAVIAILAILVAIVTPNVMREYNKAKADVFVIDAQSFVNNAMSKFTNDSMIQGGKTVYYSNIYNSDLNTRTLDIESDKNYFVEMDRNGNIKRFILYDNTFCYDVYTTYGGVSIGELEGTKSTNNNGLPISKTTLNSNAVWESGSDSVDIIVTKSGEVIESYFVKGCEAKKHSFDDDIEAEANVTSLYGVFQKELEEGFVKKYTGSHRDSYSRSATHDIYHFYADNDNEALDILNKNNVLFANQCWQMIRTTDTGGVKVLYNGEADSSGKCGTGRDIHDGFVKYSKIKLSDQSYYYSDSYTFDKNSKTFKLSGSLINSSWSSENYNSLIGKYTCMNTDQNACSSLYYVFGYVDSEYAYAFPFAVYLSSANIANIPFNIGNETIANVGYMYGDYYETRYFEFDCTSGFNFGKNVIYQNGKYKLQNTTLVNDTPSMDLINNYRFFCEDGSLECSSVGYIYYHDNSYGNTHKSYMLLNDGTTEPKVALDKMLKNNKYDSNAKIVVEAWYKNKLLSYSDKIEETIYCNDRTYTNYENSGWNPNSGNSNGILNFKNSVDSGNLSCSSNTDKFSINNPNAKLKYSIGLPTSSELYLLNNLKLYSNGSPYWTMSPDYFMGEQGGGSLHTFSETRMKVVNSYGLQSNRNGYYYSKTVSYCTSQSVADKNGSGEIVHRNICHSAKPFIYIGVRPMISLKAGTKFSSGDGSTGSPYVVE